MRGSHAVKAVRTGFIFLQQSTFVLDILECFFKPFWGISKVYRYSRLYGTGIVRSLSFEYVDEN